ncbi:MAG: PEGA domain-containing protein [Sandaracinus sp.]|nr:PEGA domain-containing protein [Sandaracinus sp.]
MQRSRTAVGLALVLAVFVVSESHAQRRRSTRNLQRPDFVGIEEGDAAREHFFAGVELYAGGDREGAVEQFVASFELRHEPVVAYNLGQVLKELRRYEEAVHWYQHFLVMTEHSEGRATVRKRRRVASLVRRLQRALVPLTLEVDPEGAEIRLDQRRIGTAPLSAPLLVSPGERTLTVTAEGFDPLEQHVHVRAREPSSLQLTLQPTRATLRVTTNLPTATIAVDGVPVGAGDVQQRVEQGSYVVEVAEPGYQPRRTAVQVADDTTLHLDLEPEPLRAYQKWWVWTLVGVVVVGAATGTAVAVAR